MNKLAKKTGQLLDSAVAIISPKAGYRRQAYRFAYEAVGKHRTHKKRDTSGGSEDSHLDANTLYGLREICRDMCRNNSLIDGLFETERDGILGSGPSIQARCHQSDGKPDTVLNNEIEAAWKEEMLDRPCDITGRFNFNQYLGIKFISYRRDGDVFTIFHDDLLQAAEGEAVGSLQAGGEKHLDVINGVAYSKQSKRLIGYYIGQSDKRWGYINASTLKKYPADRVHHMFNPRRFSQSRGRPVLASAIDFVDKLHGYVDAELVAAKVNACFSAFVSKKDDLGPAGFGPGAGGVAGSTTSGIKHEKLEPGTIFYGEPGESVTGIGMTRPGQMFDPFILRMLMFIGRPACLPLMLVTLDFAGATFMNARIAYQKVQEAWQREQDWIIAPFCSRVWRWKMQQWLDRGLFPNRQDIFAHEVYCKRWPYVDPFREAQADKIELENRTTNRTIICARKGKDFEEVQEVRKTEDDAIGEENDEE